MCLACGLCLPSCCPFSSPLLFVTPVFFALALVSHVSPVVDLAPLSHVLVDEGLEDLVFGFGAWGFGTEGSGSHREDIHPVPTSSVHDIVHFQAPHLHVLGRAPEAQGRASVAINGPGEDKR